ncbi:hypothetical protein MCHI_002159 [Candidatus Magnetoovum chiemensis]|nr:hypothetical protein MCHI_002159 [Candidatus Magnetoovum chiemensis]
MRKKTVGIFTFISFIIIISVVGGAYYTVKSYNSKIAKQELDKVVEKTAKFADIRYKDVDVDIIHAKAHINDVEITPLNSKEKIKIKDIVIYSFDRENRIPAFLHLALNGISIDIGKDNDDAIIKELGYDYDKLISSIELDYEYNKNDKALYIKKLRSTTQHTATIELSLHISNLDLNISNPLAFLFSVPNILLHEMTLTYTDASLITRLLEDAAKKSNKTIEEYKNDLTKQIDDEILKAQDNLSKASLKSVKQFIINPKRLIIKVSPKTPISLGEIQEIKEPIELMNRLKVKIQT